MAKVNVLGAGVLGMTAALELADRGYKVSIIARDLPEDIESTDFASPWAGGIWLTFFENNPTIREATWYAKTYNRMAALSAKDQALVQTVEVTERFGVPMDPDNLARFLRDVAPEARVLTPKEIAEGPAAVSGMVYKTLSFNPARYLPYLHSELAKRGVRLVRHRVSSIDEVFTPDDSTSISPADVVINASGLGALGLLGVNDDRVLPYRGQTVLIRTPKPIHDANITGFGAYLIPRPSTAGEPGREAILGGCYQGGDWTTTPDLELSQRILEAAVAAFPEISKDGTLAGVEVLKHNVGLRPGRKGGPRLESERLSLPTKGALVPAKWKAVTPRDVTVVHMYGIAGAGYQASFGMAEEAADLVDAALGNTRI